MKSLNTLIYFSVNTLSPNVFEYSAMLRRSFSDSINRRSCSARALASLNGNVRQILPSSITSCRTPIDVVTTAMPLAKASNTTMGKPSWREHIQ